MQPFLGLDVMMTLRFLNIMSVTILLSIHSLASGASLCPPMSAPQTDALVGPCYLYEPGDQIQCWLKTDNTCRNFCFGYGYRSRDSDYPCYQSGETRFHGRLSKYKGNEGLVRTLGNWAFILSTQNFLRFDLGNNYSQHKLSYEVAGPQEYIFAARYTLSMDIVDEYLCFTLFPQFNIRFPHPPQKLLNKNASLCADDESRQPLHDLIGVALEQPGELFPADFLPVRSGEHFSQVMVATQGDHIEKGLSQSENTMILVISPDYLPSGEQSGADIGSGSGRTHEPEDGDKRNTSQRYDLNCKPSPIRVSWTQDNDRAAPPGKVSYALIGLSPGSFRPGVILSDSLLTSQGNMYIENLELFFLNGEGIQQGEGTVVIDTNTLWITPEGFPVSLSNTPDDSLHISINSHHQHQPETHEAIQYCNNSTQPMPEFDSGSGSGEAISEPCRVIFGNHMAEAEYNHTYYDHYMSSCNQTQVDKLRSHISAFDDPSRMNCNALPETGQTNLAVFLDTFLSRRVYRKTGHPVLINNLPENDLSFQTIESCTDFYAQSSTSGASTITPTTTSPTTTYATFRVDSTSITVVTSTNLPSSQPVPTATPPETSFGNGDQEDALVNVLVALIIRIMQALMPLGVDG